MDMGILWPYIGMVFLMSGSLWWHYVSIVFYLVLLSSPKWHVIVSAAGLTVLARNFS